MSDEELRAIVSKYGPGTVFGDLKQVRNQTEQRVRREALEEIAKKRCDGCKSQKPSLNQFGNFIHIYDFEHEPCEAQLEQEELRRAAEPEPPAATGKGELPRKEK